MNLPLTLALLAFPAAAQTTLLSESDLKRGVTVPYTASGRIELDLPGMGRVTKIEFLDSLQADDAPPILATREGRTSRFLFDEFFNQLLAQHARSLTAIRYSRKDSPTHHFRVRFREPPQRGLPPVTEPARTPAVVTPTAAPADPLQPTGSPIRDALTLFELKRDRPADAALFSERLKKRYGVTTATPFADEFPALLKAEREVMEKAGLISGSKNEGSGGLLSSIGGLDVTTLADGLARFLVKRTKQELNAAFFERLRDLLNEDRYRDLKLIFPQTQQTLQAVGEEIYNYNAYLSTLRESFEQDLRTLPPHLTGWIDEGTLKEYFTVRPHLGAGLKTSLYFYEELSSGVHPGKAIENLPVDEFIDSTFVIGKLKVRDLTKGLIEISKSVGSGNSSKYWVGADTVRLVAEHESARKIYLALLYEQLNGKGIKLDTTRSLAEVVKSWVTSENFRSLTRFADETRRLEQTLRQAKNGRGLDSVAYERYFAFFDQFTRTADAGYRLVASWTKVGPYNPNSNFVRSLRLTRNVADLGLDVNRRKYGAAVVQAVQVYSFLTAGATDTDVVAGTSLNVKSHAREVIGNLVRYGSLLAAVAEAKTSEEVAAAIEAFALPAGSARIKRESAFNVSLNAYTGLLLGHERILGHQDNWINTFAVAAPIGVAASWGRVWGSHSSFSIFLSVIDIGAVTAFRFQNDTTVTTPGIKLKDIVSPGLALSYGIGKTPISITGGWQAGPLLREVGLNSNETFNTRYSRWYLSVAVDIPLLNFHNRPFVRKSP